MDYLPYDIIRKIAINLDFNNILIFSSINKYIYTILDEYFYYDLAIKYYTKDFWIKAAQRPIERSFPLKTMKEELLRIQYFQNIIKKYEKRLWELDDFYNYWSAD
jgi:hypothetical protein